MNFIWWVYNWCCQLYNIFGMGKNGEICVICSNLVILYLRLISYVKLYIGLYVAILVPTAMPDVVKTVGTKAKDLRTNTGNNEVPTGKKQKLVSHSSTFLIKDPWNNSIQPSSHMGRVQEKTVAVASPQTKTDTAAHFIFRYI